MPGVGLGVFGGLCPSRCLLLHPLWPGRVGKDRDLCICWQLLLQEPHVPALCHPLLPQRSITWGLSHHT